VLNSVLKVAFLLLNHWEEDVAATATILTATVAAPPTGNIYIILINTII